MRPFLEDAAGFGPWAALELGFDVPGEGRLVVFVEDRVGAERVEVFGVDQEAVHVEEAGANRWWGGAGEQRISCERMGGHGGSASTYGCAEEAMLGEECSESGRGLGKEVEAWLLQGKFRLGRSASCEGGA